MCILSVHTPVPAHATVLTADPHHNASQHMLTAIPAYPFRGLRGAGYTGQGTPWTDHQSIPAPMHRDRQPFTLKPTGNLESPINLTCGVVVGGNRSTWRNA